MIVLIILILYIIICNKLYNSSFQQFLRVYKNYHWIKFFDEQSNIIIIPLNPIVIMLNSCEGLGYEEVHKLFNCVIPI